MQYTFTESPVGRLLLATDDGDALSMLSFSAGSKARAPSPEWREVSCDTLPVLRETARQLQTYFAGKLHNFDLPLRPHGTPFQLSVWKALCDIPYGETTSYGKLAARLGNPKASRAVGLANGSNPIAIVIPCHRVIGSTGKLTGFGGGLPIKEKLLALERGQLTLL